MVATLPTTTAAPWTWLRDERQRVGLRQVDFAEAVGVVQSTVSAWEIGASAPDWSNIGPIARALGVSPESVAIAAARQFAR